MCYNVGVTEKETKPLHFPQGKYFSLCRVTKGLGGVMNRKGYKKELAREMYLFFSGYSGAGAPSFSKFARAKGLTLSQLCSYRKYKRFREAYEECEALRRDYLIDRALGRGFDGSFVKFLLDREESDAPKEIKFKLEVLE